MSQAHLLVSEDIDPLINAIPESSALWTPVGELRSCLTKNEIEVLTLASLGMSSEQSAVVRAGSASTVRNHMRNVHLKLGSASAVEAVVIADYHRIIDIEPRADLEHTAFNPSPHRVLQGLAFGLNKRQIAEALFISTGTVKNHFASIFRTLEAPNQSAAATMAISGKLVRRFAEAIPSE